MQEHTINTLKTLFTSFLIEKKDNFDEECNNVAAEAIETAVKKKAYSVLLRQRMRLPFLEKKEGSASKLTNFKEIAEQYLSQRYPSDKSFCIADWKCRVMVMSQAGLIDRGMASTWLREVDSIKRVPEEYYVQREDNSWLQHRVLRPLLGKLTMDPNMDPERLFVVDPQAAYAGRSNRDPEIVQAKHMVPKHHLFTAPYLRNIVVLVRRRQDIHNRVTPHPDFEKFGKSMGYLVYHVGLKKIEADQAREFFSKTKYTVIDMIERQDWEPEPETRTPLKQVIADYVPRPRGLVTINALRENPTSHYIDVSNHNRDGNARLVNPEFVVRINLGGRNSRPDNTLGWLNWDASQALARLYGDRGGVCPTDAQYTNYVTNKGALSLQDFLLREFVPVLQQNLPALKEWWSFQPERIIQSYEWGLQIGRKSLLETIMKIPELAQQFKIVPPKDKIKPEIIYLYDALAKLSGIDDPAFLAIKVEINAVALNPDFALLMKKVADSISFNMLDVHDIYRTYNQLKDTKNPKPRIDKFVEIFVSILEN